MINILHISDIHYGWDKPEEDGVVLDAFFEDLKINLPKTNCEENFCIISGDLVYKGQNDHEYEKFYSGFVSKLKEYIPLQNILVVAGNHDLNRTWVENNFEKHIEDINKDRSEVEFNDYLKQDDCQLLKKFSSFSKFCQEKMSCSDFDIKGYYRNITSDISIFMLNSALCASGGANNIKDEGALSIETRKINEWISLNKGRTKILVMHHPIAHLKEEYQKEIISMCKNGIDFVFAGHIHDQFGYKIDNGAQVFISPQLYSSKRDLDGYSIIKFDKETLVEIEYKEWNKRIRKFMNGQSFTGTNDGKWTNEITRILESNTDIIEIKLQEDFDNAISLFGMNPIWIERKLSTQNLNQYYKKKEQDLDYLDILNSKDSYQIAAPAQFGLTCFSYYLALQAYKKFKQKWIYINAKELSLSKVETIITKSLNHIGANLEQVDCIIFDDWRNNYRDYEKIISKIKKILSNKRLIFLSHGTDPVCVDLNDDAIVVKNLFLKEINRKDLRSLIKSVDDDQLIAEENAVVERLNQDIIALNIHRTPHNSLQFLKSYKSNFEKRPINRTKVLDGVLRAIFDNPGNLTYGGELDDSNCKFILGYFCQQLVLRQNLTFTETEFLQICKSFAESQYNSTNIANLLQVLKNNQVVEPIGDCLQFRQIYWVEYFVAIRMNDDESFANDMINNKKGLFHPDLIDFYTGIDGKNRQIADFLSEELEKLEQTVISHVGIDKEFNPFKDIKWKLSETKQGITQEKIEENIRNSRMPDDIKEAVADRNFDSVKPYTQQIYTFLDEFEVRNLMSLLRSSARAIRNSEFISPESKENLVKNILKGWESLMRVLFCIAPLMAKNGYGGYGGANFRLSEDFAKDYAECLKQIIVSMPYNIVQWYKNDFFSDKLVPLLKKQLNVNENAIERHLIAIIICDCKPPKFKDIITSYIGTIGKNTFYLGDLYNSLRNNYSYEFMSKNELSQTEYLIKSCFVKHSTGSENPGRDKIAKFKEYNGLLPSRDIEDD